MAGAKDGIFKEKLTPYLREIMGRGSVLNDVISRQYIIDDREKEIGKLDRRRHYEADMPVVFDGVPVVGVERLYKRTAVLELSTVCAAHCRWCLRGQYPLKTLSSSQIEHAAKFFGSCGEVDELLITGGEPLCVPKLLAQAVDMIHKHALQVKIIRIGARLPMQDPEKIDAEVLEILDSISDRFRTEIGLHICHPEELQPEVENAINDLAEAVDVVYNQHPLLKGVNDKIETLVELYSRMRELGIEPHYLFHCIPMRGMHHHRTTVEKGLELTRELISGGFFSGRAKPQYFAMTDIGKVPFLEGTIQDRKDGQLLLASGYTEDRFKEHNPCWKRPESVVTMPNGKLAVWYPDGGKDD